GMVVTYGAAHNEERQVVERYRLIDNDVAKESVAPDEKENLHVSQDGLDPGYRGEVLQLHFVVDDPGAFTMPWSSMITYRRYLNDWTDLICAENPHESPGKISAVPTADQPDF